MKPGWLSCLALAAVAAGQPATSRVAIAYIEGNVYLDGQDVQQPVSDFPRKERSVVRTEKGRAEILFARGDIVFLGESSSVGVSYPDANSSGLEILTGSAVVITGKVGPAVICEETIHLSDAGVFRFDVHGVLGEKFCKLKVYKGAAAAQMPSFVWVLTTGKTIDLNRLCGDHTPRNEFNIDDIDVLDLWSRQRAGVEIRRQ